MFEGHPDNEIKVYIVGGESHTNTSVDDETWVYQLKGQCSLYMEGRGPTGKNTTHVIEEGSCMVIPAHRTYEITRPAGSIGMMVQQDPHGNREIKREHYE